MMGKERRNWPPLLRDTLACRGCTAGPVNLRCHTCKSNVIRTVTIQALSLLLSSLFLRNYCPSLPRPPLCTIRTGILKCKEGRKEEERRKEDGGRKGGEGGYNNLFLPPCSRLLIDTRFRRQKQSFCWILETGHRRPIHQNALLVHHTDCVQISNGNTLRGSRGDLSRV
jgi:hypothetical protein